MVKKKRNKPKYKYDQVIVHKDATAYNELYYIRRVLKDCNHGKEYWYQCTNPIGQLDLISESFINRKLKTDFILLNSYKEYKTYKFLMESNNN